MRMIDADALMISIEDTVWYSVTTEDGPTLGASSEEYAWYRAHDIYRAIENAPTVTQGWIPVTERLPENEKFIVVANWDKGHTPRVAKANALMVQEFWGIATGFYAHGQQVTHWMPLPEPPQEVNNG